MEIITDKARGNELYATRDFEMRSAIHEETVLCCSQSMDDFKDEAPVCACLQSLETPRTQEVRNTRRKKTTTKKQRWPSSTRVCKRHWNECPDCGWGGAAETPFFALVTTVNPL